MPFFLRWVVVVGALPCCARTAWEPTAPGCRRRESLSDERREELALDRTDNVLKAMVRKFFNEKEASWGCRLSLAAGHRSDVGPSPPCPTPRAHR